MITALTLKHFQRHKFLKIKFGPGVTTLVGDTNAGKSAVVRALRVLCLNKPAGSEQISHGQKALKIKLTVDGKTVTRRKGTANAYGLDGHVYRAFGSKVPGDVVRVLAVDDVNFQRQMDPPFWFTDSPGQVSKNLNEIVNLSVIDSALTNVVKTVRDAKAEMEVTRKRHHEARTRNRELQWVKDMLHDWRVLEEARDRYQRTAQKGTALAFELKRAQTLARRVKTLQSTSGAGKTAVAAGERALAAHRQTMSLATLITEAGRSEKLAKIKLPDIAPLIKFREKADWVATQRGDLEILVDEARTAEDERCRLNEKLVVLKTSIAKLGKSKMKCPTCGQTTKLSSSHSGTCT